MNPGRRPRRVSAYSVNCETTSAAPPTSISERFVRPSSSRKIRSSTTWRASASAIASVSSGPTPEQDRRGPRPIAPTTSSVDPDRRPVRPLEERPHGSWRGAMTPCSRMNASRQASASTLVGVARVRVALDDERLDGRRHQQVVVADAVGVDLAVAAEHDHRDAARLDLVHQAAGERASGRRRERDHPVARDRRHAVVEPVLVALVGERPDEPDLAAHVAALDEQRRADDEDVDAERADELGGLAVDAAIDVDLAAVRLVAEQLARGAGASSRRRPS